MKRMIEPLVEIESTFSGYKADVITFILKRQDRDSSSPCIKVDSTTSNRIVSIYIIVVLLI